jgi:serine protease Do
MSKYNSKRLIIVLIVLFLIGVSLGFNLKSEIVQNVIADDLSLDDQEATIRAIKKVIPAVVSIVVYDYEELITINLGTGEQKITKERVESGSGTGFLISSDGLIITNKHVVNTAKEETAEYRIILNSGKQYYAQVIGKDPISDLAVLKIFDKDLPYVELGDSDTLELGTTVIAIGNSLGKYQNSVTKGIVSGLGRILIASDQSGNVEHLDNTIQTDAEINQGNSGGPLVDLNGRVIGVNTAIDTEGTAIGFALPINDVRPVIKSVKEVGRIIRPRLGVRYLMLTSQIAQDRDLPRDSGALIIKGENGEPAILSDSPAQKAGLAEGDIIFEINAIKIEGKNTLRSMIHRYKPGDRIGLKIQRGNKVIIRIVTLDEFK